MMQKGRFSGVNNSAKTIIIRLAVLSTLSGIFYGYACAIIASAQYSLEITFKELDRSSQGNEFRKGLLSSSLLVGALIGSIVSGLFAQKFGRKYTLIIGIIITGILPTIGMLLSTNYLVLAAFRLINGNCIGFISNLVPIHIGEFSPTKLRGKLGSIFPISIMLGYIVSYSLIFIQINQAQKIMFSMNFVILTPITILTLFVPESPQQLVINDKIDLAKEILEIVFSNDCKIDVDKLIEQILEKNRKRLEAKSLKMDNDNNGLISSSSNNYFLKPQYKKVVLSFSRFINFLRKYQKFILIGTILIIGRHFTGFPFLILYFPLLLKETSLSLTSSNLISLSIMIQNFLCSCLALKLVDKFGRKILIVGGFFSMAIAGVLGACSFFVKNQTVMISLFMIHVCVYYMGYALGVGSIFFLILNEIFPRHIKEKLNSFFITLIQLSNMLVALLYLEINAVMGGNQDPPKGYIYFFMSGLSLFCGIVTIVILPETKGHKLEEIVEKIMKPSKQKILEVDTPTTVMKDSPQNPNKSSSNDEVVKGYVSSDSVVINKPKISNSNTIIAESNSCDNKTGDEPSSSLKSKNDIASNQNENDNFNICVVKD